MSKNNSLQEALDRLSKMNTGPKKANAKYFQSKEGKNQVLVLPTTKDGHPFAEWWVHKGLIDPSKPWIGIACDKQNDGEECVICDMCQELKDKSFKGNEGLWKPLEAVKEMYSPVIDLDDVEAGVQWWSYGRSISSAFETWLRNIEEDEKPFYDQTSPQKIIVTYEKNAAPKDKYKLDRKNLKPIDSEQWDEWLATIKPIDEVRNNRKSTDDKEEILAAYIKAKEKALKSMSLDETKPAAKPAATTALPKKKSALAEEEEEEDDKAEAITPKKKSKLSSLNDDDDEA